MRDGNSLINAMQNKFLHEKHMGRTIITTNPKENEQCIELNGKFSIAELDALVIAQVNEREGVDK